MSFFYRFAIIIFMIPRFAQAIGYADPIFVSSTMLTNTFPTKEMETNKLRIKVAPFRLSLDVSKVHDDDPSNASGFGAVVSGVYTQKETEFGRYGFGGSLGYFQGSGKSLLLVAGSPLEKFMGDHNMRGLFASATLNMDPTRQISWFNLPMFVGFSFQSLKANAKGDFISVDRDGTNPTMPFGSVTIERASNLTGFGVYAGIGPQFVIDKDWFVATPFTMISVPFQKPTETIIVDDQRFLARVPTHDTTTFIPVYGAEFAVPSTDLSFLWVPDRLAQGVALYTLTWSRDLSF